MTDPAAEKRREIAERLMSHVISVPIIESALDAYAEMVAKEKDKWRTAALLKARTREAIWDRYHAGDSVELLAADYEVPVEWVAVIVNPGFDLSQQRVAAQDAEIDRLRKERVAIQNQERILTCVFCGHAYPPGTPDANHESLRQHVAVCEKHPAAEFRRRADQLRAALVGLVGMDGRSDLEQLEAAMRLLPAPAADKAATIDAIHALIATLEPPAALSGGAHE